MNTSKPFVNQLRMITGALIAGLLVASPVSATGVPATQAPQPRDAATATPTADASQASAGPAVENPRVALNAMVKAFTQVKAYQARQDISGTLGYISQTVTYVAPDITYIRSDVITSTYDFQKEHMIVGNTLYDRESESAQWEVSPPGHLASYLLLATNFSNVVKTIKALPGGVTSAKYVGPDTVQGVPTQAYQYQVRISKLPINATVKVWLGADHLPYRADALVLVPYKGKTIRMSTTTLFSGYNTPITITLPISVTR
jgi:hypothetical protein